MGDFLGIHVLTAITAVTAQNSKGISKLGILPPSMLKDQLNAVKEDVIPDAIKIGMIGSIENASVIDSFLSSVSSDIPVVIDPVLSASADQNHLFSNENILDIYKNNLFPRATVITPNQDEAPFVLSCKDLNAVILKGGHKSGEIIEDKLLIKGKTLSFTHPKLSCQNLHGTGCVFSTLLACFLASGNSVEDAFYRASEEMTGIIARSDKYLLGRSKYGPLNVNNYKL